MTRSEAYAEGWHTGRREAEEDIANQLGYFERAPATHWDGPIGRAGIAGQRRGYRDTWARWDAGTLTWEMLEHAPLEAH